MLVWMLLHIWTVSAQPKPFSIPQDPVAAYFDAVAIPTMSGTVPNEQQLVKFYRTFISIYSQAKVAEDQFVTYWQNAAKQVISAKFWSSVLTGNSYHLTYDIGEPVYNDARDQARFKVIVTLTASQMFGSTQENKISFVHVIKEEGVWKIVLSDEVVAEMQKLPTKMTAERYAIGKELVVRSIRLAISTVTLDKEVTALDIIFENRSDQPLPGQKTPTVPPDTFGDSGTTDITSAIGGATRFTFGTVTFRQCE